MNILEYESYHEKKSHGEPAFSYNTYLCSIPLDFSNVPLHWHDEMEIIYIKKGSGQIVVDLQNYLVQSSTIVLILPGQLHAIMQYEDCSMEYENIIFHPDMLLSRKKDSCNTHYIQPLLEGKLPVPTICSCDAPYYKDVVAPIDACDRINESKPEGYELFIKSQLYQLFFVLNQKCRREYKLPKKHKSYENLKKVLKYIENHYMERISIQEISSVADFSESHFMRYFKTTMGTTFTNYLNEYRLTIASRLLMVSDSSILNIAAESGFDNLSYFNRLFREKYGVTPSQYRKRSQQELPITSDPQIPELQNDRI